MRCIATDVAHSTVRMVVMWTCPAKPAEPIEMPFGSLTYVGQRNYALYGGRDLRREGAILGSCPTH